MPLRMFLFIPVLLVPLGGCVSLPLSVLLCEIGNQKNCALKAPYHALRYNLEELEKYEPPLDDTWPAEIDGKD